MTLRSLLKARRSIPNVVLVAAFSLLYFTVTFIRAKGKPFWFDELCTLYIVRLPSFAASWSAVLHGADYNPPLFYLIERATRSLLGEGKIAMRVPAILGFWTLCVCLFRFASKSAGPVAGWIAMLLPMFTGAYYYAYEARPHGIVLGFCGLALVSWQLSEEPGAKRAAWLLAFSVFLGAAFLTHCYALVIVIPFALSEAVYLLRWRRLRPLRWTVLTVPAVAAALSFIPLLRSYRANVGNTIFSTSFEPTTAQLATFYGYLTYPCLPILLLILTLIAVDEFLRKRTAATPPPPNTHSTLGTFTLSVGFLLVPCFGIVMALLTRGPFILRYFMSAVIGLVSITTFALSTSRRSWRSITVALVLGSLFILNSRTLISHYRLGRGEVLTEQSSSFLIGALGNPLIFYPLVTGAPKDLPIVVAEPLDFLYLVHYAPDRTPQLFYVSDSKDELFYRLYSTLRTWCHVDYNPVQTVAEFLPQHPSFLVYGHPGFDSWLYSLARKGAEVTSIQFADRGRFLATLHQHAQVSPASPLSQTGWLVGQNTKGLPGDIRGRHF